MALDSIAEIKDRIEIADLVARAGLTVVGRGRVLTTKEHDSLKLWTDTNTWYWFSQVTGGDIFDWWQRDHKCDFRRALEDLAHIAGVQLQPLTPERQAEIDADRARLRVLELAAQHYNQVLLNHPAAAPARDYCKRRGWTTETMQAARLGYRLPPEANDIGLTAALKDAKHLLTPAAKAVLSIPAGHLIYVHQRGGQVTYLSTRSIREKRHYNLPADLVGPRQPYELRPLVTAVTTGVTILVEGQADAISLAQLGFHAIALCGLADGDVDLQRRGISHVALDNDEPGQAKALQLALAIGPLTQVLTWPLEANDIPVKDANDVLVAFRNNDTLSARIAVWLNDAPHAIEALAAAAKPKRGDERTDLIGQLSAAYAQLDDVTATDLAPRLADALGVNYRQFRRLMSAAEKEADKESPSPARYENSAGLAIGGPDGGGYVFEQCVKWDEHGTASCYFAWRTPSGEIKTGTALDIGDVTYIPHPPTLDLIRKRVVLFPTEPVDYGAQPALLANIRAFIHRWLDIDPFYEQLAAYYVLFSWVYDCFETLPYLRAFGDYGTGKSRFLQTIGALCYRPMFVSGASTASPIFRLIDLFRGTLIMDEADFANSDAEAEMIKIVNVGYSRGGVVLRAEKDESTDSYYPSAKDVYGPKILATRRMFTDRATESRCLTKRMSTARPRPDVPRIITRAFWDGAQAIRNQCLMYRLRTHRAIEIDAGLSDQTIEPRLDQVTLALKAIVDDKTLLEQINTFVRAYNATLITDRQMSLPAIVVQVLAETWYNPEQTLIGDLRNWSMKAIAERVRLLLDTLDPDEKISPRRVATILTEDLGLNKRETDPLTRRACLAIDEDTLLALMGRYGIEKP